MLNKKELVVWVALSCFVVASAALAKRLRPEQWYRNQWCQEHDGKIEVVLSDRTRCDCLTPTHSVEVDFGGKWAEAVGQSLHYARLTGKRAGIVLILESRKDRKYWARLKKLIQYYKLPIDMWTIKGAKHEQDK